MRKSVRSVTAGIVLASGALLCSARMAGQGRAGARPGRRPQAVRSEGASAAGQRRALPAGGPAAQAAYPAEWDVKVPPHTRLAQIKEKYESEFLTLPALDAEDRSPLPRWFRKYVRDQLPGLPVAGPYQYPLFVTRVFEWMLSHPDLSEGGRAVSSSRTARRRAAGANINLTSADERNSESSIAQDPSDPNILVAASNGNVAYTGRQKQYFSSDGGDTWRHTELVRAADVASHSDPAVAFMTDGTVWTATIGTSNSVGASVQLYKSTDHGATWQFAATVSESGTKANDKEMLWIDTGPQSPYKNNIYVAWDVTGTGMRFTRSADGGRTWSPVLRLSEDEALGAHLVSGPAGEVYVAWPDTLSGELRVRKSTDGGESFEPVHVIASTKCAKNVAIPSLPKSAALIYLTLGVDRSGGPRRGAVYAVWTDRDVAVPADPACVDAGAAARARVFYSSSQDGHVWATPHEVSADALPADQFNPWLDVNPQEGTLHVAFYDTRDDPARRKTNLYHVSSPDGGATWGAATKVSTEQSDETDTGASLLQYGDYNGLVAGPGGAFPVWTDSRPSNPGGREQIFTAHVVDHTPASPATAGGARSGGVSSLARAGTRAVPGVRKLDSYPKEWDMVIPNGTKLEQLSREMKREVTLLPERDLEDRSPIPPWFRVYLRKVMPDLPTSGPYQYPHNAALTLQWFLLHPNEVSVPQRQP